MNKKGFSLIEILIATTILLIIMVMASMVFQQTTGAFQTGERKVGANESVRNILGMISRDLSLAVDPAKYPGLASNGGNMEVSSDKITFFALTGTPGGNVRTVQKIEYKSNSQGEILRTKWDVQCNNGTWSVVQSGGSSGKSVCISKGSKKMTFTLHFSTDTDANPDDYLPSRVIIRARASVDGPVFQVGAGSAGRNGTFESGDIKDDIYVGYNPNNK